MKPFNVRNTDVILCRAACGGLKCIKPEGKNRSAKSEKCSVGDKFMQCVYQKIDSQVRRELFPVHLQLFQL